MSKDYRFRKEDDDYQEQQDWVLGKQHHEQKSKMSKAEIARKKRESKLLSEARASHHVANTDGANQH